MSETTITVTGHAESELPPERATASVSVQFDGAEPLPVIEAATELAGKIGGELRQLHDPANGPVTAWSSDQLRTWSARPWNADGAELPPVHHVAIGIRAEFSDFEAMTSWLGWVAVLSGVSVDVINWSLLDETRERVLAEMRALAVEDAVAKARSYAAAIGRSEVVPLSISETGLNDGPVLRMSAASRHFGGGVALEFTPTPIAIATAIEVRFAAS